jgi:hypothetical protein
MSEQSIVTNDSQNNRENNFSEVSITELLQEIQQTPREYWSNLLHIIHLFRESVTLKPDLSDNFPTETQEKDQLTQQHIALSKLTQEWIEEPDEQEQTEIWESLYQTLDEERFSNCPLFP